MNLHADPEAQALANKLGYRALPVVVVSDDVHWSGYRPDRIEAAIKSLVSTAVPVAA